MPSLSKSRHLHWMELLAIIGLVLAYGGAAYQRNFVWKDDIVLWTDVTVKSPQKYRPHHNLGWAYFQKKRYDYALKEYSEALRVTPRGEPRLFVSLGNLYKETGKKELAIGAYMKALELDPRSDMIRTYVGNFFVEQGEIDPGIGEYMKALDIKPDSFVALTNLGNAYVKKRMYPEADAAYKRALSVDPYNPLAYYDLGILYHEAGRRQEAIAWYRKALDINPAYANARANLGTVYAEMGMLEQAIAEYEGSLLTEPDNIINLSNLALACEQSAGRYGQSAQAEALLNKAAGIYRRVLELDPGNVLAREKTARLLRQ